MRECDVVTPRARAETKNASVYFPYLALSSATRATYAVIASSRDAPFRAFHASHFALPLKSSMPGRGTLTSPTLACLKRPYSWSISSCVVCDRRSSRVSRSVGRSAKKMMMMMMMTTGTRRRGRARARRDERRANLGDGLDGLGGGVEFFLGDHVLGLGARDVTRGRHFSTTTMVTTR